MKLPVLRDAYVLHARIPMPKDMGEWRNTTGLQRDHYTNLGAMTERASALLGGSVDQITAGAEKYKGRVAEGYDAKREDSDKWKAEDRIVGEMLSDLPRGTSLLDCPVGTGRFLPLYSDLGFRVQGLDISADMLSQAAAKADDNTYLRIGDARKLDCANRSYDVVLCCRLFRWLETNEMQLQVLGELMRVAHRRVIFNVRTETGPLPLSIPAIQAAANMQWHMSNVQIVDDFTMFMLERHDPGPKLRSENGEWLKS